MGLKVLAVYPSRCVGCRICEQWCSWKHHGTVSPARSRVTVTRMHRQYVNVPVACSQCSRAPCVAACPVGALQRDGVTGGLALDVDACTGCRLCLESCPRGAIKMDAGSGVPLVCDLCGGDPECAKHCAERALVYEEADKIAGGYQERYLAAVARGRDCS